MTLTDKIKTILNKYPKPSLSLKEDTESRKELIKALLNDIDEEQSYNKFINNKMTNNEGY